MNVADTVAQLRAIADHIEQNNLTAMSISVNRRSMPNIAVHNETELRAWIAALDGPALRVTAEVYNADYLSVVANGTFGGTQVSLNYPCNIKWEPGLYVALAWQVGDSNEPIEVELPPAADTETAVAS